MPSVEFGVVSVENAERHFIKLLREQPSADVMEVRRGEWKINPDGWYPYCSECRYEPKQGLMTNFCPNCGVDMRGGGR